MQKIRVFRTPALRASWMGGFKIELQQPVI